MSRIRAIQNSHHTESALFTGVAPEGLARADDIHNTVSLDQVVAEKIGGETRVASLTLNTANCASLSWNRKGVPVPWERSRANLFRRLFIDGTPAEIAREVKRLEHGRSILDGTRDQLKQLSKNLGASDRQRLEVLAGSIREAELMLKQDEAWAAKPKPVVDAKVKDSSRPSTGWLRRSNGMRSCIWRCKPTPRARIVLGLGEQGQQNIPVLVDRSSRRLAPRQRSSQDRAIRAL